MPTLATDDSVRCRGRYDQNVISVVEPGDDGDEVDVSRDQGIMNSRSGHGGSRE